MKFRTHKYEVHFRRLACPKYEESLAKNSSSRTSRYKTNSSQSVDRYNPFSRLRSTTPSSYYYPVERASCTSYEYFSNYIGGRSKNGKSERSKRQACEGNMLSYLCFSGDTLVTTYSGMKRMDELQIGDYVLSSNASQ